MDFDLNPFPTCIPEIKLIETLSLSVAACRLLVIFLVAHPKLVHLHAESQWISKNVFFRAGCLVACCLFFNLNTSLRLKQEQQMTCLRGNCQEIKKEVENSSRNILTETIVFVTPAVTYSCRPLSANHRI